MNKKYDKAVAVILRGSNGIYLSKRLNTETLSGFYAVAGGRCDEGEVFWQTAIRETKEETGLDININRFILVWYGEAPTATEEYIFLVDLFDTEIPITTEPDKHTDWIEYDPEYAIENMKLIPALIDIFKNITPRDVEATTKLIDFMAKSDNIKK